ncbi:MAG: hypothetical protein KAV87_05190 [Desulfobacteraceae bacterium]|nr:hypothetical protein [Desulfobacteraceae bacterium]
MKAQTNIESQQTKDFSWAVPEELGIPPDPLRARLDFHHQATTMTIFDGDLVETKVVSALDVAHALASEISFGTGLLPPNTLWWSNSRRGPVFALYVEPKIRKCALLEDTAKPPLRFNLPMPGFIFLCIGGQPPWVYAVKKKPTKEKDMVYKAPLCNLFDNGRSCQGSHKYPNRVTDMVESFFTSLYTATADLEDRSRMFPNNILRLWKHIDNKKQFPMADLVSHGTVHDLMVMEI